jgi:hypothetical protein
MVEGSEHRSAPRALQLAVNICAVATVIFLLTSLLLLGVWLTSPYSIVGHHAWLHIPASALNWLFSLPMALVFLTFALVSLSLCTWLDSKLH